MNHAVARTPALTLAAFVLAAASVVPTAGCTGGDASSGAASDSGGGDVCTDEVPAACPASPPTYARDIAPLLQASCTTCHTPGGRVPSHLLTDYDHVFAQRGAVLSQVSACRMPPRDAPPISAAGRKALLTWLVCGARND